MKRRSVRAIDAPAAVGRRAFLVARWVLLECGEVELVTEVILFIVQFPSHFRFKRSRCLALVCDALGFEIYVKTISSTWRDQYKCWRSAVEKGAVALPNMHFFRSFVGCVYNFIFLKYGYQGYFVAKQIGC